jgi:hypothetical protein
LGEFIKYDIQLIILLNKEHSFYTAGS